MLKKTLFNYSTIQLFNHQQSGSSVHDTAAGAAGAAFTAIISAVCRSMHANKTTINMKANDSCYAASSVPEAEPSISTMLNNEAIITRNNYLCIISMQATQDSSAAACF